MTLASEQRVALEVVDLRVALQRRGIDIVDGVAFTVHSGELLAVVGESGSGKTTVGTALLAYARRGADIAGGRVKLGDMDLLAESADAARTHRGCDVAYVPQDPSAALNPALRVGYQVREVLDVHSAGPSSEREQRIREVFSEVALPSDDAFLRRYPHQLSGGQLQRVAIAMAIVMRPKVLVLDEPTTGLDVTTQARVLATVRMLSERHQIASVYVTHDLAVVSELAHRVAVMYAGRIVESGTRDEIFRAPAHPYTRALIDAIPRIGARRELRGIPGRAPSLTGRPNGCRFHDRCPLVEPACIAAEPPLIEVEPDHLSRCLRAAEVRAMPVAVRSVSDQQAVATGAPVLRVEGLNSSYAGIEVLRDIDLTVGANECVALVGESGSGKSTLSRCIAGIHDEWNGRVAWGSYELSRSARQRDQKQRKAIQYIFQNPYLSLNPRMTIGQTIRRPLEVFGLAHGKDAHRRVLELMDQVSLAHSAMGVFPDRLSGGERQRVAIARALACEPEVLICDEVTSALDVSVQASIVSLLDDLRRDRNLAMLFVTHNLALVRSLADRTLVLRNGCIIEQGPTRAVLDDPQDEYTKRLRADTPSMQDA